MDNSRKKSRAATKANKGGRKTYAESSTEESESDVEEPSTTSKKAQVINKRNRIRLSSSESKKIKKRRLIIDSSDSEEHPSADKIMSDNSDRVVKAKLKKFHKKKERKPKKKTLGRKEIREILVETDLQEQTRAAANEEKKRLKRLEELEKSMKKTHEKNIDENLEEKKEIVSVVLQKSPNVQVSDYIAQHLRPHQVEGVQFIWNNLIESTERVKNSPGSGCILAHCMGLGKTLQTIAFVHTCLKSGHLPFECVMVVAPLNTVRNWVAEFVQWCEDGDELNLYNFAEPKTMKQRIAMLNLWKSEGGVLILGYDMYRIMTTKKINKHYKKTVEGSLVDPGPDIVVCDEGHMLKNSSSNISKQINKLKTKRRLVLTGTPLQNNLIEYHCMVDFVKPDLLGSLKEFRNGFVNPILNGQHTDSTEYDVKLMKKRSHVLHQMLEGFVQRKDYSVLKPYLSSKFEYVIKVRLTPLQVKLYQHYLDTKTNRGANNSVVNTYGKGASLFSDYQNLMRVWTHPKSLLLHTVKKEKELERLVVSEEEEEDEMSMSESDDSKNSKNEGEDDKNTKNDKNCSKKYDLLPIIIDDESSGSEEIASTRRKKRTISISSNEDSEDEWNSNASSKAEDSAEEQTSPSEESDEEKEKIPDRSTRSKGNQGCRRYRFRGMEDYSDNELESSSPMDPTGSEKTSQWYTECLPEDKKSIFSYQNSSKITIFFEILKLAEERGEKVLVFSQSLISLDLIEELLNFPEGIENAPAVGNGEDPLPLKWYKNIDYFRMDGATQGHHRQRWINAFNDEDDRRSRLFLISTKAGSLGVNLVGANRVVIFDASWNPSHDTQSMFRVYRFGQKKKCYIYRLIAEGTMEEKIYQRQVNKQSLAFRVVDEQQINRHFTANSLAEMYTFNPTTPDTSKDAPTPIVPKDDVLAEVLLDPVNRLMIASYHEHDSLLDHQVHEELTEEERKAAWEEYQLSKASGYSASVNNNYGSAVPSMSQTTFLKYQLSKTSDYSASVINNYSSAVPSMSQTTFLASTKMEDSVMLLTRLGKMVANAFYQYQVCEVKSIASIMKHLKETPLYRNSNEATVKAIAVEVNYRLELQRTEKFKTFKNLEKQFRNLQEQYFRHLGAATNTSESAPNSAPLPTKESLLQQMASTSIIPFSDQSSDMNADLPDRTSTNVTVIDLVTPEKEEK